MGGDAVRRGRGPLRELATVAVVGGERQVGVEVALAQVERPVGELQDLRSTREGQAQQGVGMETRRLATLSRICARGGPCS